MLRYAALVTCLVITATAAAQGVKETVRVTITGADVKAPLVITDGPIVERANVFAGTFIGDPSGPPDPARRRYRLSFDVQTLDGIKQDAYVVHYAQGDGADDGYVYLPGPAAPEYRRNISTIIRAGHDGAWHRAEAGWARALNEALR
jgi:hypothetical protein